MVLVLMFTNHNGYMGVVDDVITHTTHDRPPHRTVTTTTDYD